MFCSKQFMPTHFCSSFNTYGPEHWVSTYHFFLFGELGMSIINWVSQYIAVMFNCVFQHFQLGILKIIVTSNYLLFTPSPKNAFRKSAAISHFFPDFSSDLSSKKKKIFKKCAK